MTHILKATYEGASIALSFSTEGIAELVINGVIRESANAGNQNINLKLGSPVQTGYEQHEFIEALIEYSPDQICARLETGGEMLAEQKVDRGAS